MHRSFPKRTPKASKGSKPRKRASGSQFKAMVKPLDDAFSIVIRQRDLKEFGPNCLECRIRPATDAGHYYSRGKFSIRWDLRNARAVCRFCNELEEKDADFKRQAEERFIGRFGAAAWDQLTIDGNETAKFEIYELKEMLAGFRKQIRSANGFEIQRPSEGREEQHGSDSAGAPLS